MPDKKLDAFEELARLLQIAVGELAGSGSPSANSLADLLKSIKDNTANIQLNVDTLEVNTDGLEAGIGAQADAEAATGNGSLVALTKNLRTRLGNIETYVDGLEGLLDGVEGALGAAADAEAATGNGSQIAILKNIRTRLGTLEGYLDQVEAKLDLITQAGNYKVFNLDLGTARAAPGVALNGASFTVYWVKVYYHDGANSSISSPDQYLRIGTNSDAIIPLSTLTRPDSDVVFTGKITGDIYLTNTAQSGLRLVLVVGTA